MTAPEITLTSPVGPADKPLLVLGHSLGTGPLIWEQMTPLLSDDFRISLLSLPGHGDAPVPPAAFTMVELAQSVADATRALSGGNRSFYAGVSIGGVLGLQLALDHDDVFAGVACIASGAQMGSVEHWNTRAATVREESTAVLVERSRETWFAPESLAREPELASRILTTLRDTSIEGYSRCAEALGGVQLISELHRITVPVLAAWGEYDSVATEAMQDLIVAGVQNGRKAQISGVAHQPPAELAGATADTLRAFFAELMG